MAETHEYKWAPDLPFMDVRVFIAEKLRQEPPSHDLDKEVLKFLGADQREPILPVTSDLDAALLLIPRNWWWHLSHLEAKIIPTTPVKGAPIDNANLYDFYGRPVGYTAMCHSRQDLPVALCEALLKARYDLPTAFVVEASAKAHNDYATRMQRYGQQLTNRTRKLARKARGK